MFIKVDIVKDSNHRSSVIPEDLYINTNDIVSFYKMNTLKKPGRYMETYKGEQKTTLTLEEPVYECDYCVETINSHVYNITEESYFKILQNVNRSE